MNDFERRFLDILQTSQYIAGVARQGGKIVAIDYFAYNTKIDSNGSAIPDDATVSGFLQVQADSDFVMSYIAADAIDAAGTAVLDDPVITAQITDTGSGKTFFSNPTLLSLVTGKGGFPFLLPAPRVVNPNTNIKVDITNRTGANVTAVYISFIGARIYYAN